MKKVLLGLAFSLPAIFSAGLAFAQPSNVAQNAIQNYIVPAYEALAVEANNTENAIQSLCLAPSQQSLEVARGQFVALVEAWSRIDFIRFGPVLSDNRVDRLVFWPDRQGIGLRQVQRILGEQDSSALTLESLAQKSVAVQGLVALEFLLFGTGSDELGVAAAATFRCSYGQTIAHNIGNVAARIIADWTQKDGIADRMISPAPSFIDFRTSDEVLAELIGIWAHGAPLIRDTRLSPMLRDGADTARPKTALFWRSGLTFESTAWMIEGMQDLLTASALTHDLSQSKQWVIGALQFEFENFASTAFELGQTDSSEGIAIITQDDGWQRANYLVLLTNSITGIINGEIAPDLGLSVGFSSLDGD